MVGTVGPDRRGGRAATTVAGRWARSASAGSGCAQWLDDDPYPRAEVEDWPDDPEADRDAARLLELRPGRRWTGGGQLRRVLATARRDGRPRWPTDRRSWPTTRSWPATRSRPWRPFGPADQHRLLAAPVARPTRLDALAAMLAEAEEDLVDACCSTGPSPMTSGRPRRSSVACTSPAVGIHLPNPFVGPHPEDPVAKPSQKSVTEIGQELLRPAQGVRPTGDGRSAQGAGRLPGLGRGRGRSCWRAGVFFVALSALRALQTETGATFQRQLVVGARTSSWPSAWSRSSSGWPPGGSPTEPATSTRERADAADRPPTGPHRRPASPSAATTSRPSSASCRARSRSSARRPAATAMTVGHRGRSWPSWAWPSCSVAGAAGATAPSSRCGAI